MTYLARDDVARHDIAENVIFHGYVDGKGLQRCSVREMWSIISPTLIVAVVFGGVSEEEGT